MFGCLEMCLQNGSVFCIWNSACNLSLVSSFSIVFDMSVTSGVTASDWGCVEGSSVVLC